MNGAALPHNVTAGCLHILRHQVRSLMIRGDRATAKRATQQNISFTGTTCGLQAPTDEITIPPDALTPPELPPVVATPTPGKDSSASNSMSPSGDGPFQTARLLRSLTDTTATGSDSTVPPPPKRRRTQREPTAPIQAWTPYIWRTFGVFQ